jgi:hypothetical protein
MSKVCTWKKKRTLFIFLPHLRNIYGLFFNNPTVLLLPGPRALQTTRFPLLVLNAYAIPASVAAARNLRNPITRGVNEVRDIYVFRVFDLNLDEI